MNSSNPARICFLLAILLALAVPAWAEHRVALLIGNGAYARQPLASPTRDVDAVAAALARLGFRTTVARDLNAADLKATIEGFAARTPTNGTALFYYAGHAVAGEKDRQRDNFLLPVDGEPGKPGKGVGLRTVLTAFQQRGGSAQNIVVVDASYGVAGGGAAGGLIAIEDVGPDTLVCFAAGPGQTLEPAADLSPLAAALAAAAPVAGQKTGDTFAAVVADVRKRTAGKQTATLAGALAPASTLEPRFASRAVAPPDAPIDGTRAGDEWVNSQGTVFCWCPPGKFRMGSAPDEPGRREDEDSVEVTLTRGFWLAKYETTRREYPRLPNKSLGKHKNDPLDSVHSDDFRGHPLKTFNAAEQAAGRLPAGWEYGLPTEAQWEYACRAGTTTRFHFGNDTAHLPRYANFADRSLSDTRDDYYGYALRDLNDGTPLLARVGSYPANPWGLHDMHGNVWEMCASGYSPQLAGGVDPSPKEGARVLRGGSWCSLPDYCRSAFRQKVDGRTERNYVGYRLALIRRDGAAR